MKTTYRTQHFSNGLTVSSIALPGMESVSLGIWVKVGGRYETPKKAGISHFLEHLLFKGTENRTHTDLKEAIEGIGGTFNAFTGEEYTCYFVKVLGKHLSVGIDILSDMVLRASLQKEEIEKERLVILEEIKMEEDIPAHFVNELLSHLLWPNHPLGTELAGTPKTIRSIRREDLVTFRDSHYHTRNIFVVACGAVRHDHLVREVKNYFLNAPRKRTSVFVKAKPHPPRVAVHFAFKETAQTHLAMGLPALRRGHRDHPTLSILNVVLGANMSSRLFQEVRENRGLAYEIGSHLRRFSDTGALIINAGVDSKKAPESIEVILGELEKLKREKVGREEFRRSKEYYTGQLLFALEDTTDHMIWVGESLVTLNRLVTPKEVLGRIAKTTPAEVMRLAKQVFRKKFLKLALIGSQRKADRKKIRRMVQR